MKLELEIGINLKEAIQTFCRLSGDPYNLGSQVSDAFGLDFGDIVDKLIKSHLKGELEEVIIKVK